METEGQWTWLAVIVWIMLHWKWIAGAIVVFILSYIALAIFAWKGWYHG